MATMKMQNVKRKMQKGFTLIELLIVLVVLSILGLVAVQLFSSVLKGTNKASVISEVKQNGQFLSDTLERHIRQGVDVTLTNPETLTLNTLTGQEVIVYTPSCSACNPKTNGQMSLNGQSITNTDSVAGVDVTQTCADPPACTTFNPIFTVLTSAVNSPKVVQVDITLNQGISAPSRQEFRANVRLLNTYSLRTY